MAIDDATHSELLEGAYQMGTDHVLRDPDDTDIALAALELIDPDASIDFGELNSDDIRHAARCYDDGDAGRPYSWEG